MHSMYIASYIKIINPIKKHIAPSAIIDNNIKKQNATHPKMAYIKNCSLKNFLSVVQYPQ